MRMRILGSVAVASLLAACAQIPNGPSVAVMPPPGKPFDLFVADDHLCRGYATQALRRMLSVARDVGLHSVEITTDKGNIASSRIIEANGGRFVEEFVQP